MATGNGQETSVSPYPRIQRNMFTETITVELPWTGYFSMNFLDKTSPIVFRLRLNSPYNFLTGNTLVAQTLSTVFSKGLSNTLHRPGSAQLAAAVTADHAFPHTVVGNVAKTATTSSSGTISASNAIPAYRAWYDKVYESYHVIKTDWSVQVEATNDDAENDINLFMEYDAYTGSSTGNVIPTTKNLRHYMKWPRVNKHTIGQFGLGDSEDKNAKRIFSGTWTPNSVAKNTKNEEDIKTWYTTGAEPSPTWVEQLVVLGMADEMAFTPANETGVNIRVDCKWLVQYKDLKQFYRYMDDDAASASTTNLVLPDDIRQIPYNPETIP